MTTKSKAIAIALLFSCTGRLPVDLGQKTIPKKAITAQAISAQDDCIPITLTDIKLNGVSVPIGTALIVNSAGVETACVNSPTGCAVCIHADPRWGGFGLRLAGTPVEQQTVVLWSQVNTQ